MLADADANANTAAWSSPKFTGRVIAALSADSGLSERAGKVFRVRDLARELGVPDDATL
jgi:hypothetical protein